MIDLVQEMIVEHAKRHLLECFSRYGIEGTEDKLNELLRGRLREFMLRVYRELLR